jgi:hypothetical protein
MRRLSSEEIEAWRLSAIQQGRNAGFVADAVYIESALSSEIIAHFLGREWWRTNLGLRPDQGHDFFEVSSPEQFGSFVKQTRMFRLAQQLLTCQDLTHFESFLDDLTSRELLGALTEAWVASRLLKGGHVVEFRARTGFKGEDFDFLVDGALAVEVKAREDSSAYSRSSLHSTLKKARQQIPEGGPGLVVVRIPQAWPKDGTFKSEAEPLVREILRNSSRLSGVGFLWEASFPQPDGRMVFAEMSRVFPNENPRTPLSGVEDLLIGQPGSRDSRACLA